MSSKLSLLIQYQYTLTITLPNARNHIVIRRLSESMVREIEKIKKQEVFGNEIIHDDNIVDASNALENVTEKSQLLLLRTIDRLIRDAILIKTSNASKLLAEYNVNDVSVFQININWQQ